MTDRSPASPRGPAPSWEAEPGGDATLEENWLLRLRRERYRSRRSGTARDFFVVRLADAVNVIALTTDRRVVLVEQFRAGSGRDSLETPGGLLDPGEDPLEAGARELLEETGYAGDEPIVLGTTWSCPSLLSSRITTVLVTEARPVAEPSPDAGEELRIELVAAREIPRLIRGGRIGHALVVQGLLWWLVAELPDTPFELPEVYRPRSQQFHIRSLLKAVALIAIVLGVFRAAIIDPGLASLVTLYLLMLPGSYMAVDRAVDPLPRSTITRSNPRVGRRMLMRVLAVIGMNLLLWLLAVVGIRILTVI